LSLCQSLDSFLGWGDTIAQGLLHRENAHLIVLSKRSTLLKEKDVSYNPAPLNRRKKRVNLNGLDRLRLINTSAMSSFQFSIDGHTLKVIESDGTCFIYLLRSIFFYENIMEFHFYLLGVYTNPTVVDTLRIGSSQRCMLRLLFFFHRHLHSLLIDK
jgi:hypothetical protein